MADEVHAHIGPPVQPEFLRPVYSNHVNINYTPHDFRFSFSLLQVPIEAPPGAESGQVELRPTAVADVVVPATLMHALLSLLQSQFENYLNQFGPPGMDPRGPAGGGSE